MQYRDRKVKVQYSKYLNDRLAVVLRTLSGEIYAIITKNLPEALLSNKLCAFVDTNNLKDIEDFIISNNLGKPTGKTSISGFCVYPEYEFVDETLIGESFNEG